MSSRFNSTKLNSLISECDRLFSLIVRKSAADENGYVKCITCKAFLHYSQIQCGHYRKRRHMSTRYNFKNCGPQCPECNETHQGREAMHALYIDDKYGEGTAQGLIELSHKDPHYRKKEIQAFIDKFKTML